MMKKGDSFVRDSFFKSFNAVTDYDNALGNSEFLIYTYLLVHRVCLWTCNVDVHAKD